jgi:serine/threonine-protein kinase
MGQVYGARDTKLAREVAIKVLPAEFASDEERLSRFEREAKLLASLNHPNIAAIYGFEESDDIHYLVLELVPGETLGERIARGPLSRDEVVGIARQITEALEEAHERGVVHRDLKPANVKLTEDGKIKVLDFGLAKALSEEAGQVDSSVSPTLTRDATRAGVIMGTAAYMSPEQARGKVVDKRSDIFSFGSLLYEMLAGRKAFPGEDVSEIHERASGRFGSTVAAPSRALLEEGSPRAFAGYRRRPLGNRRDPESTRGRGFGHGPSPGVATDASLGACGCRGRGGGRVLVLD